MDLNIGITLLNLLYATIGAIVTLVFMVIGYRLVDRLTPFEANEQLEKGHIAVGIVIGSIFVSLGIAVGLVVGLGLN